MAAKVTHNWSKPIFWDLQKLVAHTIKIHNRILLKIINCRKSAAVYIYICIFCFPFKLNIACETNKSKFSVQYKTENRKAKKQNKRFISLWSDPITLHIRFLKTLQPFKEHKSKKETEKKTEYKKIKSIERSNAKQFDSFFFFSQFWGTELCLLDGPEGGIGVPLGKKLNIWPPYWKPVTCFRGWSSVLSIVVQTFLSSITIFPGRVAVQEPRRRTMRQIVIEMVFHTGCCLDL